MHKRFLAAGIILLLSFVSAWGQATLGDKKPDGTPLWVAGWETVPAPTRKMYQIECVPGRRWHGAWPLNAAGTYEVRNALVDQYHRAGAWSQVRSLVLPAGWNLHVTASNQPHDVRSCGVVWQVRPEGGTWENFTLASGGVQPNSFGSRIATSPAASPRYYNIQPGMNPTYLLLREGGECDVVAPPPDVFSPNVPNIELEAAFAWVTHKGPTALSPVSTWAVCDPVAYPQATPGCATQRYMMMSRTQDGGQRFPPGALGYYLYLRVPGGEWHMQPKRQAAANLDDFLWQPDDNKIKVNHYRDDTPGHTPATTAESYMSDFERMLYYTKGDCVVDRDLVETYSPVVDEYEGRWGTQLSTWAKPAKTATIPAGVRQVIINGVTVPIPYEATTVELEPAAIVTYTDPLKKPYVGSEGNHKFTGPVGRTIKGTVSKWKVQARCTLPAAAGFAGDYPTFWPCVMIEGRSQWVGMCPDGIDENSSKRGCSAGVAFRDYSGGQSMSCRLTNGDVTAKKNRTDYFTQGVRVQWECEGCGGHSASELTFDNCTFSGDVHIWMEHNQTANVKFTGDTYAADYGATNRRCPTLWFDSPNVFTFGTLYADGKGTIFGYGWMPTVIVGKIFVDQSFCSLMDTNSHQPGNLTINGGHINFRTPLPGAPNWLCRVSNSGDAPVITINDMKAAEGPIRASQPYPWKLTVLSERSNLLGGLTVIEPTADQWVTMGHGAVTWNLPGIKLPDSSTVVAAQTIEVMVNGSAVPVTIQGQTVTVKGGTVNGLTSSPQVHARQAWVNP